MLPPARRKVSSGSDALTPCLLECLQTPQDAADIQTMFHNVSKEKGHGSDCFCGQTGIGNVLWIFRGRRLCFLNLLAKELVPPWRTTKFFKKIIMCEPSLLKKNPSFLYSTTISYWPNSVVFLHLLVAWTRTVQRFLHKGQSRKTEDVCKRIHVYTYVIHRGIALLHWVGYIFMT